MAHAHSLYDTDPHFRIDPATRNIINMSGKVVLVQHDHNSERFTFEIPRHVDGHDMSLCNKAEIHYINGNSISKNHGLYLVDDLQLDPNDDGYVICSWLISHNATKLIGTLNFMIRFECLTGEIIDYAWSTGVYSGVTVSPGIYNSEDIIEDYADVLEQWKLELETAGITITGVEQTITSTEDSGINEVMMTFSDGSIGTFLVRNGSRGSQGDAFTYDDFTDDQLAILKGEKGDAFTYQDFTDEQLTALTGPTGASIESIARTNGTGASGTIDTYTITLTDGRTSTFQVYNGSDGDGAGDMVSITYDPQGKATDVFAYVDGVQNNLNTHMADSGVHVTADEKSKWSAKQDTLSFDTVPTSGSSNPVTSGGIKTALDAVKNDLLNGAGAAYDTLKELGDLIDDNTDTLDALEIVAAGKQDKLTFDSTPTENSTNPVTSGGIYAALQSMENTVGNIASVLDSINGEVV